MLSQIANFGTNDSCLHAGCRRVRYEVCVQLEVVWLEDCSGTRLNDGSGAMEQEVVCRVSPPSPGGFSGRLESDYVKLMERRHVEIWETSILPLGEGAVADRLRQ